MTQQSLDQTKNMQILYFSLKCKYSIQSLTGGWEAKLAYRIFAFSEKLSEKD